MEVDWAPAMGIKGVSQSVECCTPPTERKVGAEVWDHFRFNVSRRWDTFLVSVASEASPRVTSSKIQKGKRRGACSEHSRKGSLKRLHSHGAASS